MNNKLLVGLVGLVLIIGLMNGCGSGGSSETQASRVISPLSNLIVSRAATSAALSWEASPDSDIAGYYIYRGLTDDISAFVEVGNTIFSVTTHNDTGLTSTQSYYYAIYAVTTASDQSAYSNIVTAEAYSGSLPITISGGGLR